MKRISKTRRKPLTKIGRLPIGLLLVWLLLLITGGCTQTDVEEDVIPPHALKDVDAGFNLNVLANRTPVTRSITFTREGTIESDTLAIGVKDLVQTKAAASLTTVEESQIASLWVGQYDVATGTRLFNQYISSMTSNTVNLKLKQSKSRVYFVSNAGDLGAIADTTILKKHTLAYVSTDAGLPDNRLCKMMGMWEGEVVGGMKDITVELTRLLAKITFTYSMGADLAFTPTSVILKNAPTVSQVEAPTEQLTTGDIGYTDYTGTASSDGATVYWYLPENMAGTVSGDNAVNSEKEKIGTGVNNAATCIELTGNAEQGGVTYENVTFRFFPGNSMNNYDIERNAHYTMAVTLVGIDVSDKRITVGKIPDMNVDDTEMPAQKGGTKAIQITARPGQPWEFKVPDWLSAMLDESSISSGATFTHQGPAKVVFEAVSTNPKAEKRSVSFNINVGGTDQEITIVQTGATLAKGDNVSLAATKDSEGSSSFTATEGLQWSAALSDSWLSWSATNPGISGEAPTDEQALKVKATISNPSAQPRSGTITVKAGASVGDADYAGLKQEIAVEQAGSAVTSSQITIAAEGVSSQKSSFTATAGLDWAASKTADWITLTEATSGNPTTGSSQEITFDVPVNPYSSERNGDITVRAGDASVGPTGTIGVTQSGSSLTVGDPATLAATKDATGSLKIKGTSGLPLTITLPSWLEITTTSIPDKTNGSEQTVAYKTIEVNLNSTERVAENIPVKAGEITKTVAIKQSGSTFTVSKTELSFGKSGGSGTVEVEGTSGLPWTVSPSVATNGITPNITSSETGNEKQTLTFTATENSGGARSATFTIAVTGGEHSKTVEVKQAAAPTGIIITIDQSVMNTFITQAKKGITYYPPFDYDGTEKLPNGCAFDGTETMTGTYSIEVEKGQTKTVARYTSQQKYCSELNENGTGWRIPTLIELHAIYINRDKILANPSALEFINGAYWSSSVTNGKPSYRSRVGMTNGPFDTLTTTNQSFVRCVRDT